MKSIVEEVKQSLVNATSAFEGSDVVKGYQKAIVDFEELVRRGLAQKRGNQLMSPVDAHLSTQGVDDPNDLLQFPHQF